jgi:hypothetical protein
VLIESAYYARRTLTGSVIHWNETIHEFGWSNQRLIYMVTLSIFAIGFVLLMFKRCAARRLLLLLVVAMIGHRLALVFAPYFFLPQRYLIYTMPLILAVGFPVAGMTIADSFKFSQGKPIVSSSLGVALTILVLLLIGGRGTGKEPLNVRIPDSQRPIYTFLSSLPDDALIAGWPGGVIENTPYLAARRTFLTRETHQAFHKVYVEEMRRRMSLLIDAYFGVDLTPLLRLRDEFGITHMIVKRNHYRGDKPTYFKPFDAMISRRVNDLEETPILLHLVDSLSVFEKCGINILDLRKIEGEPTIPKRATRNQKPETRNPEP